VVPNGVDVVDEALLGLIHMEFDSEATLDTAVVVTDVEPLEVGASAGWALCLSEPDEAWFVPLDEEGDMEIAAFVIGAWDDADGDANPTPGEALVGHDSRLVLFARGVISTELADLGVQAGWNVLVLGGEGVQTATHIADAYDDYQVQANLLPHTPGTLLGTLVPDLDGQEISVGLYSMWEMFDADQPAAPTLHALVGIAATGDVAWDMKGLTAAPPEDHLSPMDPDFDIADVAFYVGGAWVDTDGDLQVDIEDGEPVVGASITPEGVFVMAGYVRPTSFLMAQYADQIGLRAGWGLYRRDESETGDRGLELIDWDEGMEIVAFSPNG
jgi:hypothetical protein